MKTTDFLKTMGIALTLFALIWLWLVEGIDGAGNLVLFWVWAFCLPLSLVAGLSDSFAQNLAKQPGSSKAQRSVVTLVNLAGLGLLVWYGATYTAVAWGLTMLILAAGRAKADRIRAESAAEVN